MIDKFIEIVVNNCEGLNAADLNENTDFAADLGLTSLDIVNIISEAEETFGKEIPEEELENIRTIGDVVKLLSK